jgi:transcriptional regulator GlxA family with amidase domain
MPTIKKPLIALLVSPETTPAILYGLYDVLTSVGPIYSELVTGVPGKELLDIKIVAASKEPFYCCGNVPIEPHASIDEITRADAVVVSDMYLKLNTRPRESYPELIEWIKQMHANNSILTSVCTGAALIAETDLLDGLEVTAYWAYWRMLHKHFPQVKWCKESILSFSGKENRVITAGGGNCWEGLSLYLTEYFCGLQHAINTAKIHMLSGHASDNQQAYSVMRRNHVHNDAIVKDIQSWIEKNYATSNPVYRMTELSGLDARTFLRRFKSATGYSPLDYVHELRVETAKSLLETTDNGVDQISNKAGYDDTTSFRRLFKKKSGLTPSDYRKKFVGIMGTTRKVN